jgi:hypothetical protein
MGQGFKRTLAPGVFDVHTPVTPTSQEIRERLRRFLELMPAEQIMVAPDSQLRTRTVEEVRDSLRNMVEAAVEVRSGLEGFKSPRGKEGEAHPSFKPRPLSSPRQQEGDVQQSFRPSSLASPRQGPH